MNSLLEPVNLRLYVDLLPYSFRIGLYGTEGYGRLIWRI